LNLLYLQPLNTNLRFNKVSDIVIYDRPEYKYRFLVNYVINNVERDLKLRFRFSITSKYHTIPSITTLFQSSIWVEREGMDMFGLKFIGNPDLRRILCDYGFWGFPGRKDYPLVGIHSYFYSLNFLRVFRVRGMLNDFWSIYFQKKINKQWA
jgi:NADH:ubiquinone oxidoreductase subunit C